MLNSPNLKSAVTILQADIRIQRRFSKVQINLKVINIHKLTQCLMQDLFYLVAKALGKRVYHSAFEPRGHATWMLPWLSYL